MTNFENMFKDTSKVKSFLIQMNMILKLKLKVLMIIDPLWIGLDYKNLMGMMKIMLKEKI